MIASCTNSMPDVEDDSDDSSVHDQARSIPSAEANPSPCTRPKQKTTATRHHPAVSRPKCPRAVASMSVACDRRRQIRHRCRPATTAIERAMTGSTSEAGTATRPSAARMKVTEWATVKAVAHATTSRRRRDPAISASRNRMWSIPPRRCSAPRRKNSQYSWTSDCCVENVGCWRVEGGAARLQVEVVGHDRLGVAHVALGVREQPAAQLVRLAGSRAAVVEHEQRVRDAVALLDR